MDEKPADELGVPNAVMADAASGASQLQSINQIEGPATSNAASEIAEEPDAPMTNLAHPHAPHGGINSWRDFFVHIIVVTIGLLLALGLEQSVEYLHRQSERTTLEREMRETFAADIKTLDERQERLENLRSYLIDLRAAVSGRLAGREVPAPPLENDPRNDAYIPPTNFGPFEAMKANGTVALLSLEKARLYERIEFQHSRFAAANLLTYNANNELRAFRQRFDLPPPIRSNGIELVDLATLSNAQLIEYQTLLGNAIEADLIYASQARRLRAAYRAVLDGAQTDNQISDAVYKQGLAH
jgi:hypothetical protein